MPDRPAPRHGPPNHRPTGGGRPAAAARLVAALVAAALAAGCGGSDDDGSGGAAAEVAWVRDLMTTRYLYAERVPAADLTGVLTAEAALEALRVNPPDRFSYVERRDRYRAFFDEGQTVGLGIVFRAEADALALRVVQPASPAAAAGLRRGDRILAIDGTPVATLLAEGRVNAAIGPSEADLTLRLTVRSGAAVRDVAVTKAAYPVSPVLTSRLLEHGDRPVGYVALYTFVDPTGAAWTQAIDALRAAGARTLVVDLRDNGGGRLFSAAEVAGSLVGPTAVGQPFVALRYNARRAADARTIPLPAHPAAGSFDRVAWLVSEATCSAAEVLVAGLLPYRADASIGTRTCGKPVGFDPQTRGDTVLSAVTFATVDRDGRGDWFDGLAPTCEVTAEPLLPLGDPSDPRLAQALHWLDTGRCAAPVAEAAARRAPPPQPPPAGLARETGLH